MKGWIWRDTKLASLKCKYTLFYHINYIFVTKFFDSFFKTKVNSVKKQQGYR